MHPCRLGVVPVHVSLKGCGMALTLSSKSPAVSAGRLDLRLGAVLLQSTISSTPPEIARSTTLSTRPCSSAALALLTLPTPLHRHFDYAAQSPGDPSRAWAEPTLTLGG